MLNDIKCVKRNERWFHITNTYGGFSEESKTVV
jgi:hypothetical protein